MRGIIISFEGIDGSGKSTQSKIFADHLLSIGKTVLYLREPGCTELGERVRGMVKEFGLKLSPYAELFLFLAARAQMISEKIVDYIDEYQFIIFDRYYHSSVAYQTSMEITEKFVELCNKAVCFEFEPQIVVFLDADPELPYETKRFTDRIECKGISYLKDVACRYRQISSIDPRFIKIETERDDVDCSRKTIDEVSEEILTKVRKKLKRC